MAEFDIQHHLPKGVTYHPGSSGPLIALNEDATIRIDSATTPANQIYEISDRGFTQDFANYFSDDYSQFQRNYQLKSEQPNFPIYSGAEHTAGSLESQPKLPNITVIPNVIAKPITDNSSRHLLQENVLLGCTMGHWHGEKKDPEGTEAAQEVYEFLTYGALVIDRPEAGTAEEREESRVEMWLAKPGDKVPVPHQCHMTLYNLNGRGQPLITLDFANPDRNYANKNLVDEIGPILMVYYQAATQRTFFKINRQYIERGHPHYDGETPPERNNWYCLSSGLRSTRSESFSKQNIIIDVDRHLSEEELGLYLYQALKDVAIRRKFADVGIKIRVASPDVNLSGLWVYRPLIKASHPAAPFYRYFFPEARVDPAAPLLPDLKKIIEQQGDEIDIERAGNESDSPLDSDRRIGILIEGAGDWVNQAIIPAVENLLSSREIEGLRIVIWIADTSFYRTGTPDPLNRILPPSDEYPELHSFLQADTTQRKFLDKSFARDLKIYRQLDPALIFVVTPDHTHGDLCLQHLVTSERARAIFVEKPFEAQREKSNKLCQTHARKVWDMGTAELRKQIAKHEFESLRSEVDDIELDRFEQTVKDDPDLHEWVTNMDRQGISGAFSQSTATFRQAEAPDHIKRITQEQDLDLVAKYVRKLGHEKVATIFALDHYRYYTWRLEEKRESKSKTLLAEAWDWIGGAIVTSRFALAETDPIIKQEGNIRQETRAKSLRNGMVFDLLPHYLALLTFFADLKSIDNVELTQLGRYKHDQHRQSPYDIDNETFAEVRFTVEDNSGNGWPVKCQAWVGKGLEKERKFFEVEGANGRSVLINLASGQTRWCHPIHEDQEVAKPGIYFIDNDGRIRSNTRREKLDRKRYAQLMADLVLGTRRATDCTMTMADGHEITRHLARIAKARTALYSQMTSYNLDDPLDWDLRGVQGQV